MKDFDIQKVSELIRQLRDTAEEIKEKGQGIETINRNVDRLMACVRMLELNISDIKDIV